VNSVATSAQSKQPSNARNSPNLVTLFCVRTNFLPTSVWNKVSGDVSGGKVAEEEKQLIWRHYH
jgi:hypothetical protein